MLFVCNSKRAESTIKSMARKILFFSVLVYLFFLSPSLVHADVYIPIAADECHANEEYFKEGGINPNLFKKIRPVTFQSRFLIMPGNEVPPLEKGFCVNRVEYCSKNKCDLYTKIRLLFSPLPHIKNILINLIINIIIISTIHGIFKIGLPKLKNFLRIGLITIVGYCLDLASFFFGNLLTHLFCFLYKNSLQLILCGSVDYKSSLETRFLSPISLSAFGISTFLIFIAVSLFLYKTYSGFISQEKDKRIIASAIFGLLSNPVWYFLAVFLLK